MQVLQEFWNRSAPEITRLGHVHSLFVRLLSSHSLVRPPDTPGRHSLESHRSRCLPLRPVGSPSTELPGHSDRVFPAQAIPMLISGSRPETHLRAVGALNIPETHLSANALTKRSYGCWLIIWCSRLSLREGDPLSDPRRTCRGEQSSAQGNPSPQSRLGPDVLLGELAQHHFTSNADRRRRLQDGHFPADRPGQDAPLRKW